MPKTTMRRLEKTVSSPQLSLYYENFDETLGEMGIISLKNVKEVVCTKPMNRQTHDFISRFYLLSV